MLTVYDPEPPLQTPVPVWLTDPDIETIGVGDLHTVVSVPALAVGTNRKEDTVSSSVATGHPVASLIVKV